MHSPMLDIKSLHMLKVSIPKHTSSMITSLGLRKNSMVLGSRRSCQTETSSSLQWQYIVTIQGERLSSGNGVGNGIEG